MPLYTLTMRDAHGVESKILYSTEDGTLTDEHGVNLLPEPEVEGKYSAVNPISPSNPGKKTSTVKKLKIQLGLKCNYSCSYCSQASHIGEVVQTNTEDAREFLRSLEWISDAPEHVEFWGGEPFVYWPKLKVLVPELRKRWPDTRFSTVSNGSLLDDEKIEWLDLYGFEIAVSHDGPGQPTRGPDPLDDPEMAATWKKAWAVLGGQGRMSFNAVITPTNYNVTEIVQFFRDRIADDVRVGFEGVVNVHEDGAVSSFNEDTFLAMQRAIVESFYTGSAERNKTFVPEAQRFLEQMRKRQPIETLGQGCGMDRPDYLAVDLMGNVLTCQNVGGSVHTVGHTSKLDDVKLNTSTHFSHREECRHCPVIHLCAGSCMFLEGEEWYQTCQNEYHYNMAILTGIMLWFTGKQLVAIDGDIRRPKPPRKKFPYAVTVKM